MTRTSVIVPVYNGGGFILGCLESLKTQASTDFEAIVVNDGSTDNTRGVVENFISKLDKKHCMFRLINRDHAGPAAARNAGVREATGELVLFTDADCVPENNWIEKMEEPFADGEVEGVGGTYNTLNSNSLMARLTGYEIASRHARMAKFDKIDFIGTFSAGYRKKTFESSGGFDTGFKTSSGEDPEISFRMAAAGKKLVFQPSAKVAHRHPDSLLSYLKQKYNRGFWRVLLYKKHPSKMKGESYTPPHIMLQTAATGLFLLSVVLSFFSGLFATLASASIAFVLLINMPFYGYIMRQELLAGFVSIPVSILRNAAFVLGIMNGLVHIKI